MAKITLYKYLLKLLDNRHRNLLLLQNSPMKRRQVGSCPEDSLEIFPPGV